MTKSLLSAIINIGVVLFYLPHGKEFVMRPTEMTLDRVCQMDKDCGEKVRAFRQQILLSTFDHEDNAIALLAMAQDLGVSFDELCSYVWLQTYVAEMVYLPDPIPSPQDVAEWFGISWEDFRKYLDARIEVILREIPEDDSASAQLPVDFPWESEIDQILGFQRWAGDSLNGE